MSVLKTHAVRQIKMCTYKTFKHHQVVRIFFFNCETIVIVYLARWIATLLCGTSHRVGSNEANPCLVRESSQSVVFVFSYCSQSRDMVLLFFLWMQDCLQIAMFHCYVTIPSPASSLSLIAYTDVKRGCYFAAMRGKWPLRAVTSGIVSWPASVQPYSVTAQVERFGGNTQVFKLFSLSALPNG